jgi:ribonuclease HII
MTDLWELENEIAAEGFETLCGVDEAGRGPLAGPVYAAAVILPRGLVIPGLNDSKKLTEKRREQLFDEICEQAESYSIAFATVEEIEERNILGATMLAMNRALAGLKKAPDLALIDGNRNKGIETPSRCVVKGDARCADIAAASILAKVSRDRVMLELAKEYPEYHFEQHKGYGTALHYAALREYGPSPVHRPSFLKKMH